MAEKLSSFGTKLKIGDGTTAEAFTAVAQVLDVTGPGLTLDREEVTTHDSTSQYREWVDTLKSGGDVTFDIVFDPGDTTTQSSTSAGTLLGDFQGANERNFKLVPAGSTANVWDFAAHVTGFEPSAPVEGFHAASVTLGITGFVNPPTT